VQQNREPRNRLKRILSTDFYHIARKYSREKIVFSTNGAGTTGYPYANCLKKA
jgi:hypothetical protein